MTRRAVVRTVLESSVESRVVKSARALYGVESIKVNARLSAGWPDRWFLVPGGRPLVIEFKAPGVEVEAGSLQEYRIAELERKGYDVHACDSYDEAMALVRERV